MKTDKIKSLVLQFSLCTILLIVFFFYKQNLYLNLMLAGVLLAFALAAKFFTPFKRTVSIYKKQSLVILIIFAVINVAAVYVMGIYFGFYRNYARFTFDVILLDVVPIAISVIASEYIRFSILSSKAKWSGLFAFASMVLVDVMIFSQLFISTNVEGLMSLIGFVFLSAVVYNLLFNYLSIRFGMSGVVAYRMITTLYMFLLPIVPNIYMFFRIFIRMLYPCVIYLFVKAFFATREVVVPYKKNNLSNIVNSIILVMMVMVIGLVSCKFKYCLLIIGSESMTGSIDKGDGIIYEAYDGQYVQEGDVLVFDRDGTTLVHRVIKVENVEGQIRYTTKGDANQYADKGYVVSADIIGICRTSIKFIGFPTLWINEIVKK